MKRILAAIGVLLCMTGCADPGREPIPDCTAGAVDSRCVLCVDARGDADWYYTGDVDGQRWEGCPKGTLLVRPY